MPDDHMRLEIPTSLQRLLDNYQDLALNMAADVLNDTALYAQAEIAPDTPVDTGALRNSLRVRQEASPAKLEAATGFGKDYAVHVEYGTKFMKGRHMMANHLDDVQDHLDNKAQESADAFWLP